MQFKVASVLALAATASAWASSNVSYTTEVVTAFTTYCPEATTLSFNGQNYTVTESTTLTITNCPCTVSKPVYTTSSVVCTTCAATTAPVYSNSTSPASTAPTVPLSTGATSAAATAPPTPSTITSNGGKVMAVSGAGLAALLGLAAYVL